MPQLVIQLNHHMAVLMVKGSIWVAILATHTYTYIRISESVFACTYIPAVHFTLASS